MSQPQSATGDFGQDFLDDQFFEGRGVERLIFQLMTPWRSPPRRRARIGFSRKHPSVLLRAEVEQHIVVGACARLAPDARRDARFPRLNGEPALEDTKSAARLE